MDYLNANRVNYWNSFRRQKYLYFVIYLTIAGVQNVRRYYIRREIFDIILGGGTSFGIIIRLYRILRV